MCDVLSWLPSIGRSKIYDMVSKFLLTATHEEQTRVAAEISRRLRQESERAAAAVTLRMVAERLTVTL